MKLTDMHVHTHRSADSDETMPAYIARAKEIGVGTICFTDHVDINPHDYGYAYYSPEGYLSDLDDALKISGSIKLLSGIEFGEPYLYRAEFEKLCRRQFDFVMGSVHYPEKYPSLFFSELVSGGVTAEDCYASYWDSVRNCVRYGKIDCLGHIDIPKRYYGTLIYNEKLIREIYHIAVENGIIIEINTSSLRRGVDETMPGPALLELYSSEGGKYSVIGSDAHCAEDLGAGFPEAKALLDRYGLKEVIFVNRKMLEVN